MYNFTSLAYSFWPPNKHLGLLLLLFCPTFMVGQTEITGKLTATEGQGVPFANVLLVTAADSSFVAGSTTAENGAFRIALAAPSAGYLHISCLGFEEQYVLLRPQQTYYAIELLPTTHDLEGLTVTAHRTLYELKSDRIVMNVGTVPALGGNTALQVLQRAPGVIVDQQNNRISLNSRGEVMVMINERIQRVPMAALIARLSSMPAENIDRIEIIHQPPAKYDIAGSGGLINIVLKKRESNGTNASARLMAGYGQREKLGAGFNLNARFEGLNIYADYAYNLDRHDNYQVNHYRQYDYQGVDYLYENRFVIEGRERSTHSANVGLDLSLPGDGVIGILTSFSHATDHIKDGNSLSIAFEDEKEVSERAFELQGLTRSQTLIANVNWQQPLSEQAEIAFNLDYAGIKFRNSSTVFNAPAYPAEDIRSLRNTPITIWTVQGDLSRKDDSGGLLEAGIKGTFSNISSDALVEAPLQPDFVGLNFSGEDQIDEQILAAYASYQRDFSSRFSWEAGFRFEHYDYDLTAARVENDLQKGFDNLFPLLRLQWKPDSVNTLQLSFNRSMTRADFWQLTGYFIFLDPTILAASNPRLLPAFTNNYRLSYQRGPILGALTYSRNSNNFFFLNTVDKPNHLQTSLPSNLDRSESLEASLTFPLQLSSWWENAFTLSALHQWVKDEEGRTLVFTNDIITYTAQFNSTFTFGSGWSASIDGRYMSDFIYGDQVQYLYPYLNAGIRKQFPSGASLSLSFQDITNSIGRIEWAYDQPELGIRTFGDNNWSERQIRLTYTYAFGNDKIEGKRDRQTAEEVRSRL